MQIKELLRELHANLSASNSVSKTMAYLEMLETTHDLLVTFVFVSDTPSSASALTPIGVSIVDYLGEEWSTPEMNTVARAFAIRTNMVYDHHDLLMTHSEWHNPDSKELRGYHLCLKMNVEDTEISIAPVLTVVK